MGPKTADGRHEEVEGENKRGLIAMVHSHFMVILDNIVTMDKSVVLLHTPETKQQSSQWLPKGQPGPVKAKVHATRTK